MPYKKLKRFLRVVLRRHTEGPAGLRKLTRMKNSSSKHAHGVSVPATTTADEVVELLVKKGVVARATQVSTRLVELWMQRRLIPFVRLSKRCVRFHLPSVLAALRKMEVKEATRQ